MDEIVTRRILTDEFLKFEERFEVKIMRNINLKLDEKFEQFDKKFYEMSEQIEARLDVRFDQKFSAFEDRFDQHARNMGALIEEQNHKIQALAEGIMMQIETNERKWQEQGGLNGFLEKRVTRLESEVLIA